MLALRILSPPANTRRWSLEFGTISSSIDSMPEALPRSRRTIYPRITVFRKHFGALSEGGMSIARYCQSKKMGSWMLSCAQRLMCRIHDQRVRFKDTRDSKNASGAKASRLAEKSDDPKATYPQNRIGRSPKRTIFLIKQIKEYSGHKSSTRLHF